MLKSDFYGFLKYDILHYFNDTYVLFENPGANIIKNHIDL
jgi:hypothetical protein